MFRVSVSSAELNEFNLKLQENIDSRKSRNPVTSSEIKSQLPEVREPTLWRELSEKWLSLGSFPEELIENIDEIVLDSNVNLCQDE